MKLTMKPIQFRTDFQLYHHDSTSVASNKRYLPKELSTLVTYGLVTDWRQANLNILSFSWGVNVRTDHLQQGEFS